MRHIHGLHAPRKIIFSQVKMHELIPLGKLCPLFLSTSFLSSVRVRFPQKPLHSTIPKKYNPFPIFPYPSQPPFLKYDIFIPNLFL